MSLLSHFNASLLNKTIDFFSSFLPQTFEWTTLDKNNIVDNKCFLSSKSAYYYDFWRSCDTEDWSNDAENTALITSINYILQYICIENS